MVIVPQKAPDAVRVAALQRRITACRASAKVLCCSQSGPASEALLQEAAELEAELLALTGRPCA